MNLDALKEAATSSNSSFKRSILPGRKYALPLTYANLLDEKVSILEFLGLSFSQRVACFLVCFVLGAFFGVNAVLNIFSVLLRPWKFAVPCGLSSFFFFFMMGFLVGFKSYFLGIFARDMAPYTGAFVFTTFMTVYGASWKSYPVAVFFAALQVGTSSIFFYMYLARKLKNTTKIFSVLPMFGR